MNRAIPPALSAVALPCRVEPADIDAMLDAYDSGMSDASTANCVSLAVSRALRCERPLPLFRFGETQAALAIGDCRVPLPPDLVKWLASAETGGQRGPKDFVLQLPAGALDRPVTSVTRQTHHARPPRISAVDRPIAV